MTRKLLSCILLAGTLTWSLSAGPCWSKPEEAYDPMDPEVIVSLQTRSETASTLPVLQAGYWVSRPEMILVTLPAPGAELDWPRGADASPPLRIDGASLPPRRCFVLAAQDASPARLQVPMTLDEFAKVVTATQLTWTHGEVSAEFTAEQRAPLRELWDILRPMVSDPGFRAHALLREGSTEAIATLLRGGWGVNRPTYVGRPPLLVVAAQGNMAGLNALLQAGASLDGVDRLGRTALHHAIVQGHTNMAVSLLERGASMTHADGKGLTPLHLAVSTRNALLVQDLLERGAAPNPRDARGMSPLQLVTDDLDAIEVPDATDTGVPSSPSALRGILLRFGAEADRLDGPEESQPTP